MSNIVEVEKRHDSGPDPKLTRAREIINPKNAEYNPKTRLLALTRLAMEFTGVEDCEDPLFSRGLIALMPGQPNTIPLSLWLDIRSRKIARLAHEDPNDFHTDAYDLMVETADLRTSFWMQEAKVLNRQLMNNEYTLRTEVAIKLMYGEALAQLYEPEGLLAVNEYLQVRTSQALGQTALDRDQAI